MSKSDAASVMEYDKLDGEPDVVIPKIEDQHLMQLEQINLTTKEVRNDTNLLLTDRISTE